jgi:hypothetical protein
MNNKQLLAKISGPEADAIIKKFEAGEGNFHWEVESKGGQAVLAIYADD